MTDIRPALDMICTKGLERLQFMQIGDGAWQKVRLKLGQLRSIAANVIAGHYFPMAGRVAAIAYFPRRTRVTLKSASPAASLVSQLLRFISFFRSQMRSNGPA